MAHGTPALFHGSRGQARGADQIADTINVRNSCLTMFVDGQRPFFVTLKPVALRLRWRVNHKEVRGSIGRKCG